MTASKINPLYQQAIAGDEASTKELFEILSARFRTFAHQRIWDEKDAEEIVQDALTIIFHEYQAVAITISFAAWAYKVLDNRILNYVQKRRRESLRVERLMDESTYSISDSSIDPELKRQLLHCLRNLGMANIRYARVLNLVYQGYETEDICRRMNLKRNTLYSHLSRARWLLMACLKKGGADV